MPKNASFLLVIIVLVLGSCVPIKRLTYLQENQDQSIEDLVALQPSIPPYRLQVNDLLSIYIKTLSTVLFMRGQ